MKHRIAILLLALTLGLPIVAIAQDTPTDVPAFETATIEAFTPVPTEAPTIEPTLAPTETPVPVPSPIDNTKVTEGLFATISVLVASLVAILFTLIVGVVVGLPLVVRVILLSIAKNLVAAGTTYAKTTETKTDDAAFEELTKYVERLEAELNKTNEKVYETAHDLAVTKAAVQNVSRN